MAGPTVGHAEISVDFDGRNLVGQAKALAQKAGGDAGTYFSSEFGKGMTGLGKQFGDAMKKNGDAAGISFTKAFQNSIRRHIDGVTHEIAEAFRTPEGLEAFITSLGGVEEGAERTRAKLAEMSAAGAANNAEFDRLTATLEETVANMRTAADETERQKQADEAHYQVLLKKILAQKAEVDQLDRLGAQLRENFAEGNKFTQLWRKATTTLTDNTAAIKANDKANKSWWKSLSRNTRQWTLIIGAIAAGGEAIATLGSAIGPGILTLGAAITQVGIGAGVMFAAFKGLNGEIDDLPAPVRAAATAFQNLGDAFDALQDQIQIAALENSAGAFESIQRTVEALTPAFQKVAKAVGRVIDQFAAAIAPGTKGFANLNKIIEDSADVFEDVLRVVGKFGAALGNVFASPAMQRSVQELIGWVEELADAFLEFTEGPGLETWFSRASQIFGGLGRLLEATGSALAGLVDDAAVGRLVAFLDNLTGFMPSLERLLSMLGELDVFGLIAQALNDLGDALEPLAGPLEDLFDAVNDIVSVAIDQWAEDLGGIAEAVAPAVQVLADALGDIDPKTVRLVADGLLALAGGLLAVKAAELGITAITALSTALKGLGGKKITWKVILGGLTAAGFIAFFTEQFNLAGKPVEDKLTGVLGNAVIGALIGLSVAGPWGAAAGALVGAIGTSITTAFSSPKFQRELQDGFDTIAEGKYWDSLSDRYDEAFGPGSEWETQWGSFLDPIDKAGDQFFNKDIPGWFAGVFEEIGSQLETDFATYTEGWNEFWGGLGTGVATAWTTITTTVATAWTGVTTFLTTAGAGLGTWWDGLWAGFPAAVSTAWTTITMTVVVAWNAVWIFLSGLGAGIATWWNGLWAGLPGAVSTAWATITTTVATAWTGVWTFLASIGAGIASWWNGLWSGFPVSVSTAWGTITGVVVSGWTTIANFFRGMGGTIASIWTGIWTGLGAVLGGVWAGIIATVSGAVNTVIGIINRISGAINGVLGAINNLTGGLVNLKIPKIPGMAAGGITSGLTFAGEAGPEMIIPLHRPLSMIDPSVRGYAAALRGDGGGVVGGPQKVVTVMPGAIVVQASAQPINTAAAVLDRMVARL